MEITWALVLAVLAGAALPTVAALVWRGRWLHERVHADADRAHWQQVFDALDIGLLVFDAEDRVRAWNTDFERVYPEIAAELAAGQTFEFLVRRAVKRELIAEAGDDTEAWVAARLRQHRRPKGTVLRRMANGHWRRITERYLADGGMVSYSVDVTDLVENEQALAEAEEAARQAEARLREAIEAMPAGFELFDADDRVVLCNGRTRAQFPRIWKLFDEGATFEELVRRNADAGGLDEVPLGLDELIARRQQQRAAADGTPILVDLGHRQYRMHERRTGDGGLVSIRVDVTDELAQRQALEQARQRLQDAIEALPDGFALYDAEDRLVLCNERYRSMYRETAPALQPGTRFEDILRYGLDRGQYPQALGREPAWLDERLRTHREPGPPILQELPGNRWLRVDERRTRDGGIAGVRADVTAMVRREQTLERLNRELDLANARLAQLIEHDTLTGVASAAALERRLAAEWARTRRHGPPLALLRVTVRADIDDAATHETHLRAVATQLGACARRPGDLVARIGDHDFALLLPHTGAAALDTLVRRCIDNCGQAPYTLRLQIGGAASDEAPAMATAGELRERAEAALHPIDGDTPVTWRPPR